ncbi:hypothetical protein FHS89_000308 [Rubricella aquisinus]|uniref:DUF2125 domain-containing protein n=1 Tax=Rubricella aquisinus TaxID=2028108 RepID=A0A840WSX7_9RHOB|nr:DUF2125 domain-containing protein [Rubricella aquisinus]MBB5514310.1 hypothetical protein [Rubricella aquisinus]
MRTMLLAGLALLIGWSAYWWLAASSLRNGIDDWLTARQADGWIAEYADLGISGYPSRVDARFDDLALADPARGWAWSAPAFQILALSYRDDQVILAFPGEQSLATPRGRVTVSGAPLRASVNLTEDQVVQRLVAEADDLTLTMEGDQITATRMILATEEQGQPRIQRLGLTGEGIMPSAALRELGAGIGLADTPIERVTLDATATFAAPPGLAQLGDAPPALDALSIADLSVTWAMLSIRAQGMLTADANGFASGEIALRLRNWQEMLDMAVAAGAIRADVAPALQFALGLMAGLGGDRDALDATVSFRDGVMAIGPVVIGTAPRMALP